MLSRREAHIQKILCFNIQHVSIGQIRLHCLNLQISFGIENCGLEEKNILVKAPVCSRCFKTGALPDEEFLRR